MIETNNLTKKFGSTVALNNVTLKVEDGSIFGLVGSNGAGKSTLLRILAGVYVPDGGTAFIDAENPFENNACKDRTLYISDNPYFFAQSTMRSMANFYKKLYSLWSEENYLYYKSKFSLDENMKISKMSKGMQRQAALILGLSTNPKTIFFDEIFDGLDPIVRELLKRILIEFVTQNKASVIIASHNLRELEDLCDHVGFLHKGGIVLENDLDSLKLGIHRVQCAFENPESFDPAAAGLDVVKSTRKGKIIEMTVRGDEQEILKKIEACSCIMCEILPLTLEEMFISEMEVAGYDINNLVK